MSPTVPTSVESQVLSHSWERISRGSMSFSLAARFFPQKLREGASLLYSWCRYCDDETDLTELGFGARPQDQAVTPAILREWTLRSLAPDAKIDALPPSYAALALVASRHPFPAVYCMDLIDGMEDDRASVRYETLDHLRLYCYRVAGTVGLLMSHIMGLRDERALDNAVSLGIALQLTNIARDVGEDFERGRIYLPLEWLRAEGLEPTQLLNPAQHEKLFALVERLLRHAEEHYVQGVSGLEALPLRASFAVAIAASVYRGIGEKILSTGPRSLQERTILTGLEKAVCAWRGLVWALRTIPKRIMKPQKQLVTIQRIWRPQ